MGPPGLIDYAASKAGVISLHEGLGLELLYRHNAPRVRTSLVVPSYVKTPMFAGTRETSQPWFVMPLLEPETVAEAVVERVVSGEAATVFLPGFMGVMTIVVSGPGRWRCLRGWVGERDADWGVESVAVLGTGGVWEGCEEDGSEELFGEAEGGGGWEVGCGGCGGEGGVVRI